MTIESYMYDYNKIIFVVKKNHFEYPYPALFWKIREKLRYVITHITS